jgi:hypothetical protein
MIPPRLALQPNQIREGQTLSLPVPVTQHSARGAQVQRSGRAVLGKSHALLGKEQTDRALPLTKSPRPLSKLVADWVKLLYKP